MSGMIGGDEKCEDMWVGFEAMTRLRLQALCLNSNPDHL
jgi:hypothetical protein